jgi:peptide/nickel transport system permease protein
VFVTGMLLVLVFSLTLGWLPPTGYVPPREDPWGFLRHLVLPVLALAAAPLATTMRMTRASFLEHAAADYARTARAKGCDEDRVVYRHCLRNSLITMITLGAGLLAELFGGVLIVEQIFSISGLGRLLLDAAVAQDAPLLMAATVVQVGLLLVGILAADLLYTVADPRLRSRYG